MIKESELVFYDIEGNTFTVIVSKSDFGKKIDLPKIMNIVRVEVFHTIEEENKK